MRGEGRKGPSSAQDRAGSHKVVVLKCISLKLSTSFCGSGSYLDRNQLVPQLHVSPVVER